MRGPKSSFTIRDHFTCRSWNLVSCISCCRCPLYVGVTGRNLRTRFSEHLGSICNNTPGFPLAQHFNSMDHRISDVPVLGVALCSGTNTQREQREIKLIFQLGTIQRKGMNINFSFIWTVIIYILHAFRSFLRLWKLRSATVFLTLEKGYTPETSVF